MGVKIKFAAFSLSVLIFSSASLAQEHRLLEDRLLKNSLENFTLSYCLAQGELGETLRQEAEAAEGAYFERGSYPVEAHKEAADVAKKYLKKTYSSRKPNIHLTIMKCIDASQSKEITEIKNRYSVN